MNEINKQENQIYAMDYVNGKVMAESTIEKLIIFAKADNLIEWDKMTQENKVKFYDFIREAYAQGNIHVDYEEFLKIVNNNSNLSESLTKEYFTKYQKGVEILLLAI